MVFLLVHVSQRSSCKHASSKITQNVLIPASLWSCFSGCYRFTFSILAARSPPPGCFYSWFILFSPLPSFVFSLLVHVQYIILLTGLLTLLYFISIHQKRERSLNMSVWGIVMELITFHLTMNIDQGRADERPNKCRYTHTYPFSQAVPSPGPFFPALLVFNLSLVLSCTFIKSLTFLNMKLQGCN